MIEMIVVLIINQVKCGQKCLTIVFCVNSSFLSLIHHLTDIECGLPASIPHGGYNLINGTVGYLSTVLYRCNDGYEMLGRALLTCDIDERWNGPPPRCELIECDSLPSDFENGQIVALNGTYFGSKAEVICDKGYTIEGSPSILCSGIGQWSEPLARCVKTIVEEEDDEEDELVVVTTTQQPRTVAPPVSVQPGPVAPIKPRTTTTTSVRRPTRPSTRFTTTPLPTRSGSTVVYEITDDEFGKLSFFALSIIYQS